MNTKTPFIEGFCRGIAAGLEEELAAMEAGLTPEQNKDSDQVKPSTAEIRQLAESYNSSVKTLRRLLAKGVDITQADQVALAISTQKNVSVLMLETVASKLDFTN